MTKVQLVYFNGLICHLSAISMFKDNMKKLSEMPVYLNCLCSSFCLLCVKHFAQLESIICTVRLQDCCGCAINIWNHMCIVSVEKNTTTDMSGLSLYKTQISSCINVHKLWSEPQHHWSNQIHKKRSDVQLVVRSHN